MHWVEIGLEPPGPSGSISYVPFVMLPLDMAITSWHVAGMSVEFLTIPTNKSINYQCSFKKNALLITSFKIVSILKKHINRTVVPDLWKVGTIIPIPRNALSKKVIDYTPISVLPAPSALIDRRSSPNQILYHLESHRLLDRH